MIFLVYQLVLNNTSLRCDSLSLSHTHTHTHTLNPIYTWGYGGCVRLGHGDLGERRTPTRLGKEWFAGRQSYFALQAVVECRALEPECFRVDLLR